MNKTPITIISGFLGAGKTTLLNNLLTKLKHLKIALVINEFGAIGFDADLVTTSTEEKIELASGCMCCTVRKDFMDTITKLTHPEGVRYDHIIIETSGLADPYAIAQTFQSVEFAHARLDAIITVVDALNYQHPILETNHLFMDQIATVHLVVCNKVDSLTESQLSVMHQIIRRINNWCTIVDAIGGELDVRYVTDSVDNDVKEGFASYHRPDEQHHHSNIRQHTFATDRRIHTYKLEEVMGLLSPTIFRIKGITYLDQMTKPFVIHKVGSNLTIEPYQGTSMIEESQFVFIGNFESDQRPVINNIMETTLQYDDFRDVPF